MAKLKLDDIADELAASAGLSKRAAKAYTDFVFKSITAHLADGDSVMIASFGKFDTAVYAARKARNVRTTTTIQVPAKHRIKFEMSRTLLDAFNSAKAGIEDYDE